jgi:DNA-binding NarL/FixJ family response regulator
MPSTRRTSTSADEKRGVRVVVVDDHPLFRRGLADVLRDEPDMTVSGEVGTIADALEAIAMHSPDVAVVDLSLGGENGLNLVSQLVTTHPGVRVLVLSASDERLHADRALKAGALGYIMKNEAATELIVAVRRVAAGKSYVSPETADRILLALGGSQRKTARSPLDRLSNRERHVLTLMGQGVTTRAIARQLSLSVKTVEAHYAHIKEKLGIRNGRELMRAAVKFSEA